MTTHEKRTIIAKAMSNRDTLIKRFRITLSRMAGVNAEAEMTDEINTKLQNAFIRISGIERSRLHSRLYDARESEIDEWISKAETMTRRPPSVAFKRTPPKVTFSTHIPKPAEPKPHWLNTLPAATNAKVTDFLATVEHAWIEQTKFMDSASDPDRKMDECLPALVKQTFVKSIRSGETPGGARFAATAAGVDLVNKFNQYKEPAEKRSVGAGAVFADDLLKRLQGLL